MIRTPSLRSVRLPLPEVRLLTNERWVDDIAMYTRLGYRETHGQPFQPTRSTS